MISAISRLKAAFEYRKVEASLSKRDDVAGSQKMFFIVSAGRSGSTLLRKHLIGDDKVSIPPESEDFIPEMAKIWVNDLTYQEKVNQMIGKFSKSAYFEFWEVNWESMKKRWLELPESERRLANLIYSVYQLTGEHAVYIGDKTPYLVYYLDWIRCIFPECNVVYLIRDGRAVVNSYIKSRGYSLEKACSRWKSAVSSFLKSKDFKEGRSYIVRYENFVQQPKESLQGICDFLGVPFTDKILNATFSGMGDSHLSHHENVKNDINAGSIDKWKKDLQMEDIKRTERIIGKELKMFSYEMYNG